MDEASVEHAESSEPSTDQNTEKPSVRNPDSQFTRKEQGDSRSSAETQTIDISNVRQALRNEKGTKAPKVSNSSRSVDAPEQPAEKESFKTRLKNGIGTLIWNTRLASIMAFQLGGVRPQKVNGEWSWVVKPWARISDNPNQYYASESDYYLDRFIAERNLGTKVIDMEKIGGKTPSIRPVGFWGLQYLDHRRIKSAQAAGIPIKVNISTAETFN